MWIGLDDTDSKNGGCTTFICFEFISRLYEKGYCLRDFPRLVRLNPQVPWKTRGNGAVALCVCKDGNEKILFGLKQDKEFYLDPHASEVGEDEPEIISLLEGVLHEYAEVQSSQTNPGYVYTSKQLSDEFYKKTVHQLVTVDEAIRHITHVDGSYVLKKNGRGIIGATAALSWDQSRDHTFELIAYRKKQNWKTPRNVEEISVKQMDETYPSTFDNYDYHNKYNCIVPHSPCPILFGIRGDRMHDLTQCNTMIHSEPRMGWMIFISNQGTDDHVRQKKIAMIDTYQSVIIRGTVDSVPIRQRGGHVFFTIVDDDGSMIDCAAYEPTKEFRHIINALYPGDEIEVYGGIREKPLTVNIEKIKVLDLVEVYEKQENPLCQICGKHMKSKGKDKGYYCKACKTSADQPVMKKKNRDLDKGFYEVPVCARRHLAKPLKRMNIHGE